MKILKPILGSMFAALLLVAGPANAKKVTMNIGYSVNEGHPYGTFMHLFAERFETLSGGTVRVKVHCCHKMVVSRSNLRNFSLALLMEQ